MADDLEFPNGALITGAEAAFGADLTGDQDDWVWTALTPAVMDQSITKTRGRSDESSDVAPTSAPLEFDNPDGDLTPDNAASPHYPDVDLGTPVRWWLDVGLPRLYLRPARISSAEVASDPGLDLSGDLDVRIDMHLKTMDPSGAPVAIAGRADDGGAYSWRILVYPDRTVELLWSATGTPPPLSVTSGTPVVPMSARSTLRVTLDVNNGAGGRTATFYTGESVNGPFTQVGATVVQAGTTSIANVSEPLIVGSAADLPVENAPDADVYAFQLLDGIGGTALADADFTAQTSGAGSFVDDAGQTWVMFGAELTNRWYRIVGTGDEWAPTWPWGDLSAQIPGGLTEGEARVDVAVSGILRRLGQGTSPLGSALRRALVVAAGMRAYWPMEDEDGSTQIASGLPGRPAMAFAGDLDLAADSDLPGSRPLPTFGTTASVSGSIPGPFAGVWQADWYLNVETLPASPTTILAITGAPGSAVTSWVIQLSTGNLTVNGYDVTATLVTAPTSAPTDMAGGWVHLQLLVEQDGANVDMSLTWQRVAYPAATLHSLSSTFAGVAGSPVAFSVPAAALLSGLSMGHLSFTSVADTAVAGNAATGWLGDTAAERMARLFAEEGVLFRVIGDPATTERMGPQQDATLLTLADDAENVDGGILYEMPDAVGMLYRTRESMYNQPPNMILDAHQEQLQNPFSPILDDQRLRNNVTVTRRGGLSYQAVDEDSMEDRGDYPQTETLNLYSDSQVQDAAGWLLHQGTVPGMRYPSLVTRLGDAPEKIAEWLTVDQGAQVHVINLPPQHPTGTVRVIAEGYAEEVAPTEWTPTMNCSPASVWDVSVIDGDGVDDQYLLRLETDGSALAGDIDATDTAFDVYVYAGPAWVTDPAEFPFDIRVGGERMTVTDIDAPAGAVGIIGAGNSSAANTTNHVAPSVVATAAGDLLICAWQSFVLTGTYTPPVPMANGALTSGVSSSLRDARQTLAGAGATGTRTAAFTSSDHYSAVSVAVHAFTGSPTIVDYVSGYANAAAVTLTTAVPTEPGDWLVGIQGWDAYSVHMSPPDTSWTLVADSPFASVTSRVQVWAKRVTDDIIQSVNFRTSGGTDDNHARLYVLRGVASVTQLFTVTRSVNGTVKAHGVTEDVTLWNAPVLAR